MKAGSRRIRVLVMSGLPSCQRSILWCRIAFIVHRAQEPDRCCGSSMSSSFFESESRPQSRASIAIAVMIILTLLLAVFAWQQQRPLWEPDETRYATVALNMLDSGDYLHPKRHPDQPHWTKPPLTYWISAAAMGLLGEVEFAARMPSMIGLLLTLIAGWLCARPLGIRPVWLPVLILSSTPIVLAGAHYLSTDMLLCGWISLCWACWWRAREVPDQSLPWILLMWLSLSLAFMTKGPPALLFVLPLFWYSRAGSGVANSRPTSLRSGIGTVLFLIVGLGWYLWVIIEDPALLSRFVWEETLQRSISDSADRSAEWYGAFKVYLPTLLLGWLPWTGWLISAIWRSIRQRKIDSQSRILLVSFCLPLLVLCLLRSRMPLYLLPLILPASLMISLQLQRMPKFSARVWLMTGLTLVWVISLTSIRQLNWFQIHEKNQPMLASRVATLCDERPNEVLFVEIHPPLGLRFYLGAHSKLVQFDSLRLEFESVAREGDRRLWLVRPDIRDDFLKVASEAGVRVQANGSLGGYKPALAYFEPDRIDCRQ